MKTKQHMFGFGETIQGILRKYNRHNMPQDIANLVSAEFNKLNGEKVPRVGQTFQIPIYYDDDREIREDKQTQPEKKTPKSITEKMPKPLSKKIATTEAIADDEYSMMDRQKRRENHRKQQGIKIKGLPEKPKKQKNKKIDTDYTNVTPIDKLKDKVDNTTDKPKENTNQTKKTKRRKKIDTDQVQTTTTTVPSPKKRLVNTVFNPKTRNRRKRITP